MTAPDDAEAVKEIDAIMARMDALVVSPVNACAYRDACRAQAKAIEALQADNERLAGHMKTAADALRGTPGPTYVDGAVVYRMSDDVPESISVALSYLDAAITTKGEADE